MALLAPHLAAHPDDVRGLCLAAQAHLGLDRADLALKVAGQAAALAPDDDWALRLVSVASVRRRLFEQARAAANAAIRVAPHEWRCHLQRANVDVADEEISARTFAAARKGIELAPNEPEAHFVLGRVALAVGALPTAEASFRATLRLNPDHAIARHELARVHLQQRKLGKAAVGFADAVALDPDLSVGLHNLTMVVARALRIAHLITWAALMAAVIPPLRLSAFGIATVALVGFAGVVYVQGGRRGPRLFRSALRADRPLAAWAVALLIAYAGFGIAVSGRGRAVDAGLAMALGGLFVGVVASWWRAYRLRRRRRVA